MFLNADSQPCYRVMLKARVSRTDNAFCIAGGFFNSQFHSSQSNKEQMSTQMRSPFEAFFNPSAASTLKQHQQNICVWGSTWE